MYRAVTWSEPTRMVASDDDLIDDSHGALVTGKTANARTAKLYDDAVVTPFGKFEKSIHRNDSRSRMTIMTEIQEFRE